LKESGTLRIGKEEHKGCEGRGQEMGLGKKVTEGESVKEGGRIRNMKGKEEKVRRVKGKEERLEM
jgi:hypothetical protein